MTPPSVRMADDLYRFVNKAKAGHIRVDADELTYSMHVGAAVPELEQALFDGTLPVDDLPARGRATGRSCSGGSESEPSPAAFCSRHGRWTGSFGYFPSYTLGAMYAAQFHQAAREELGENVFDDAVKSGDFSLGELARSCSRRRASVYETVHELCVHRWRDRDRPGVYVAFWRRSTRPSTGSSISRSAPTSDVLDRFRSHDESSEQDHHLRPDPAIDRYQSYYFEGMIRHRRRHFFSSRHFMHRIRNDGV